MQKYTKKPRGLYSNIGTNFDRFTGLLSLEAGILGLILLISKSNKSSDQKFPITSSKLTKDIGITTDIKKLLGITYSVFHSTKANVQGHVAFDDNSQRDIEIKEKLNQQLFSSSNKEFEIIDDCHSGYGITALSIKHTKNNELFAIIGGLESDRFDLLKSDIVELTKNGLVNQSELFVNFCLKQPTKPIVLGQSMGTIPALVTATLLDCKAINIECRVISPEIIQDVFNLCNYIHNNSQDRSKLIEPSYEQVWLAITNNTTILNITTSNWWNSWRSPALHNLSDQERTSLKYYTFGRSNKSDSLLDTTLFGTHRGSKSLAPVLLDENIVFNKPGFIPLTSSEAIYINGTKIALSYMIIGCIQLACLSLIISPALLPVTGSFALAIPSSVAILTICMLIRESYKVVNSITHQYSKVKTESIDTEQAVLLEQPSTSPQYC